VSKQIYVYNGVVRFDDGTTCTKMYSSILLLSFLLVALSYIHFQGFFCLNHYRLKVFLTWVFFC
jgi:hypothetical protein